MKHLMMGAALVAALSSGIAGAQGHSNSSRAGDGAKESAPAKKPDSTPATGAAVPAYPSPFADYRPFTPQEPPKNWRAANDEVRDIGGHIGLMKSEPGGKAQASKGGKQ